MERFLDKTCDPRRLSPLTLAFIGDCVFELFVREHLVCGEICPVNTLHKKSVEQVCCAAQAKLSEKLLPILTEEERSVYMRGRNAHVSHVPKNASVADYHAATALETLFGYLYLKNEFDRLSMFFKMTCGE